MYLDKYSVSWQEGTGGACLSSLPGPCSCYAYLGSGIYGALSIWSSYFIRYTYRIIITATYVRGTMYHFYQTRTNIFPNPSSNSERSWSGRKGEAREEGAGPSGWAGTPIIDISWSLLQRARAERQSGAVPSLVISTVKPYEQLYRIDFK